LVEADRDAISRDISGLGLYHGSDAGRRLAARFDERKERAYLVASEAISNRQNLKAIEAYKQLEGDLGFPKLEIEMAAKPKLIELVMTVRPKILEGCSDQVMSQLRTSMAIDCIAGRHAPKHLLRDVQTGIRLDAKTAARMIYFFARHCED